MKTTVQDILNKLAEIDKGIDVVNSLIDEYGRKYPGQEPLNDVIDLLEEYRLRILETKIDI